MRCLSSYVCSSDRGFARNEQQKPGRRVRRRGNEDVDHLLPCEVLDLRLSRAGNEADRPDAAAWVFEQDCLAKGLRLALQNGLEDLFRTTVDRSDDWHPRENAFHRADDEGAYEAGRQGPDQGAADRSEERRVGTECVRKG